MKINNFFWFKSLAQKIGIDGVIIFTVLERSLQVGGGMLTLIFMSSFLSSNEMGYYYTFSSILAIQVFFELGFASIITQYVAHEKAHLSWINELSLSGPEKFISRLSSLLHFSVKWFVTIGVLLFLSLVIVGNLFFNFYGKHNAEVDWLLPWLIISLFTSLNLIAAPIFGFIEGLGMIKEVAKIRLIQQIIQLTLALIFYRIGFKLYSTPLSALIAFSIIPIWIIVKNKFKLLYFIWNKLGEWKINYREEIFPYQWKIALSWISSFFIFQFFNPIVFATEGAVVAGQMGMSMAILNIILMFPLSWIMTKGPIFSGYVARKEFGLLDALFNKTLFQSTLVNAFLLLSFFGTVNLLRYYNIELRGKLLGERFLPSIPLILMMIPVILNHITISLATYLRSHKEEPMMLQSVTMAFLSPLLTIFFGTKYGVIGVGTVYTTLTFIGFVWAFYTFRIKKKLWHNE